MRPFVQVDIGALSPGLFESELFGHVKGSFTGAFTDKVGKFELANGGTILLDEIANIPASLQAKILTVIQQKIVTRVGSNNPVELDIRIIAATNKNLKKLVAEGLFREDLYYRLNIIEIELPPLRERKEDIPVLAEHFLKLSASRYSKKTDSIEPETMKFLRSYPWPGNVRELQHAVERAVILSSSSMLSIQDFNLTKVEERRDAKTILTMSEHIKEYVIESLARNNGNISKTAIELNISRSRLYREINKYGI